MGQREDLFGQRALDVVVREVQRGERVGDVGDTLEGVDFVVGEVDDFNVRGEFVFVEDEVDFVPAGIGDDVFGEVDFGEVGQSVEVGRDGADEVVVLEVDLDDVAVGVVADHTGIGGAGADVGGGGVPRHVPVFAVQTVVDMGQDFFLGKDGVARRGCAEEDEARGQAGYESGHAVSASKTYHCVTILRIQRCTLLCDRKTIFSGPNHRLAIITKPL